MKSISPCTCTSAGIRRIHALAAAAVLAASAPAQVTVSFHANTDNNAGGLTNVVDGDAFRMGSSGVLGNTDNQLNSWDMTFVDANGDSVTLRVNVDIVGNVLSSGAMTKISDGESVAIWFELLDGQLESLSLDDYAIRALTAPSGSDGYASEAFSVSDNLGNVNTFYGIDDNNGTISLLGTHANHDRLTDDPNYALGVLNATPPDPDAGLNVLTVDNIDSWVWKISAAAPGITGKASIFALNKFVITVTPVASPSIAITDFDYDAGSGDAVASIAAGASTGYKFTMAPDLDFSTAVDVTLNSATAGTLSGNAVQTTGAGEATVQFNLGTGPKNFVRAEPAP